MAQAVRIVIYEDGYPRELLSAGDWKRALADGSLEEASQVTVYRDGATPEYMKARDIAELQPLFRPVPPTPAEPPRREVPPPPPPPPIRVAPPAVPAQDEQPRPSPWAAAADPSPGEEAAAFFEDEDLSDVPAWQPEPSSARPSRTPLAIGLVAIACLILFVWIAASTPGAPAPATVYRVTGTANVRTLPSADGSRVVGQLRRDDVIVGVPRSSGGETWIEISEGANAGLYVWGRNLAAAPR